MGTLSNEVASLYELEVRLRHSGLSKPEVRLSPYEDTPGKASWHFFSYGFEGAPRATTHEKYMELLGRLRETFPEVEWAERVFQTPNIIHPYFSLEGEWRGLTLSLVAHEKAIYAERVLGEWEEEVA